MYERRQTLPDTPEAVFEWHARPGAIHRLTPPWQPVRVIAEADNLRDGAAVLGFPGRRRWVAQHQPSEYREGERFVDELTSRPFVVPLGWRHSHEIVDGADQGTTVVVDRLETPIPARLLDPIFNYRHRQLADDLAAHRWAAALQPTPLTVGITGASGTVGSALGALLSTGGHRVVRLVRGTPQTSDERRWSPRRPDPAELAGLDVIVHLAGASIAGRFTAAHKALIRDSRVEPSRLLAQAAEVAGVRVFVCASAIGYYGADAGDAECHEDSPQGNDFLAEVVGDWEAAANSAPDMRVVSVRTGIVQTPRGGALRLQRPLFAAGLGGPIGSGDQWLSWIGIDDLVDVYLRAVVDDRLTGPVNAVAPRPVTSREYARCLGATLRRPAILPVPAFGPALLLGREGAQEVALASQRVAPTVLAGLGHRFRQPELADALSHILGRGPDAS